VHAQRTSRIVNGSTCSSVYILPPRNPSTGELFVG
jgi:hypothetical protein